MEKGENLNKLSKDQLIEMIEKLEVYVLASYKKFTSNEKEIEELKEEKEQLEKKIAELFYVVQEQDKQIKLYESMISSGMMQQVMQMQKKQSERFRVQVDTEEDKEE